MYRNKVFAVISMLSMNMAAMMHQPPEPIIKIIIGYATDQSVLSDIFKNFKVLMKFRQVSKAWKSYCDQAYEKYLKSEKELMAQQYLVDKLKFECFRRGERKEIKGVSVKQQIRDKKIAFAVQKNLLFYLHKMWKKAPERLMHKLEYLELMSGFTETHRYASKDCPGAGTEIYPITWAVFEDALSSIQFFQALFANNEQFQERYALALQHKEHFTADMEQAAMLESLLMNIYL